MGSGMLFNQYPGTMVAEWNAHTIKLWHFKEGQEPADLASDQPRPGTWDTDKILAWMPLDASTCGGRAMSSQELIFNIELCGDFAGSKWDETPMSLMTGFGKAFQNCQGAECCGMCVESPKSDSIMWANA